MTVDVTPVNDAPTSADHTITINEGATAHFGDTFAYADVENHTQHYIQITAVIWI